MQDRAPILFDVMSTLVFDPFYELMPAYFGMTLKELIAEKHPEAWLEFELGNRDEAWFLDNFFADGRAYDQQGLLDATFNAYAWLPGMEALCENLAAAGHPLHLVSNYPDWYAEIERRLGLGRYCRWTFVSFREGLRKPAAKSYHRAAELASLALSGTIFVDDNKANVAAACELGMDGLLFEDAPTLLDQLQERGILVGEG